MIITSQYYFNNNNNTIQVADRSSQHEIMLQAIQNHNPSVLIIDEIGSAQEVKAAKTIAQRGVALVGTAHGTSLDSLMKNSELLPLLGGLQAVILSEREASDANRKLKKKQDDGSGSSYKKLRLERAGAPTFQTIVEIRSKFEWEIYEDVAKIVDAKLRSDEYNVETRWFEEVLGMGADNNNNSYGQPIVNRRMFAKLSKRMGGYSTSGGVRSDRDDE